RRLATAQVKRNDRQRINAANGAAAAKASEDVLAQTSVASVLAPVGESSSVAVNSVDTKTKTIAAPAPRPLAASGSTTRTATETPLPPRARAASSKAAGICASEARTLTIASGRNSTA